MKNNNSSIPELPYFPSDPGDYGVAIVHNQTHQMYLRQVATETPPPANPIRFVTGNYLSAINDVEWCSVN